MKLDVKNNRKNVVLTTLMTVAILTLVASIATSTMVSSVSAQSVSMTQKSVCKNGTCYTVICFNGVCKTYPGTNYKVSCKTVNGKTECYINGQRAY